MIPTEFQIRLPDWVREFLAGRPGPFASVDERMRLTIDLARRNVEKQTGGPFGAAVFDRGGGSLIAVGVNVVVPQHCSAAHAEIVALSLAQASRRSFTLRRPGEATQLVTSVEPCAMCLGAIPWSGVSEVVCGASDEDAREVDFEEGLKPEGWADEFAKNGINVLTGVLREEAREVLQLYADSGGVIYNR